ncbi:MAG: NUDIX domain-containing protein [Rhizomicrobium sp.]|jgi:nudix-type nucleoside diphosphatase (YffH/AdpP family)
MTAPEIEKTEIAHRGWTTLSVVTFVKPDGTKFDREIEDHGRAACVLAYDPERRTALLVRQFRAAIFIASGEPDLLEAVAGVVDEDDGADTARREAMEEAGVQLRNLETVANVWTAPGISTERSELFLASYSAADRTGEGGGLAGENEEITVVEIALPELAALADTGGINDMKTFALVQTLRLRHPALFREQT